MVTVAAPGTKLRSGRNIEEADLAKLAGITSGDDQLSPVRTESERANLVDEAAQRRGNTA